LFIKKAYNLVKKTPKSKSNIHSAHPSHKRKRNEEFVNKPRNICLLTDIMGVA